MARRRKTGQPRQVRKAVRVIMTDELQRLQTLRKAVDLLANSLRGKKAPFVSRRRLVATLDALLEESGPPTARPIESAHPTEGGQA